MARMKIRIKIKKITFFPSSGPTGSISSGANKIKDKDKKIILFPSSGPTSGYPGGASVQRVPAPLLLHLSPPLHQRRAVHGQVGVSNFFPKSSMSSLTIFSRCPQKGWHNIFLVIGVTITLLLASNVIVQKVRKIFRKRN